jgi:hypothetical protein
LQAYTVEQVAKMLHIGRDKVYELLRTQCHLAYFRQAAVSIFSLVRTGFASFMVAGASCRVPCWPGFLTG